MTERRRPHYRVFRHADDGHDPVDRFAKPWEVWAGIVIVAGTWIGAAFALFG